LNLVSWWKIQLVPFWNILPGPEGPIRKQEKAIVFEQYQKSLSGRVFARKRR